MFIEFSPITSWTTHKIGAVEAHVRHLGTKRGLDALLKGYSAVNSGLQLDLNQQPPVPKLSLHRLSYSGAAHMLDDPSLLFQKQPVATAG